MQDDWNVVTDTERMPCVVTEAVGLQAASLTEILDIGEAELPPPEVTTEFDMSKTTGIDMSEMTTEIDMSEPTTGIDMPEMTTGIDVSEPISPETPSLAPLIIEAAALAIIDSPEDGTPNDQSSFLAAPNELAETRPEGIGVLGDMLNDLRDLLGGEVARLREPTRRGLVECIDRLEVVLDQSKELLHKLRARILR